MTVCIAAIAQDREIRDVVVCCTDARVSLENWTHGNRQFKFDYLRRHKIAVLMAGGVSAATEAIAFFRDNLKTEEATGDELFERFQDCADKYRTRLVDRYLRSTWAVTLEEYKQTGCRHRPEEYQSKIADDISSKRVDINPSAIELECELAFICFEYGEARLLTLHRTGRITEETSIGFTVIGSGTLIATDQLHFMNYTEFMRVPEALYAVFEAKKRSESEVNVGSETFMCVVAEAAMTWVSGTGKGFLEDEFNKRRTLLRPGDVKLPASFFMAPPDYETAIKTYSIQTYTEVNAEADDSGATPSEGEEASD